VFDRLNDGNNIKTVQENIKSWFKDIREPLNDRIIKFKCYDNKNSVYITVQKDDESDAIDLMVVWFISTEQVVVTSSLVIDKGGDITPFGIFEFVVGSVKSKYAKAKTYSIRNDICKSVIIKLNLVWNCINQITSASSDVWVEDSPHQWFELSYMSKLCNSFNKDELIVITDLLILSRSSSGEFQQLNRNSHGFPLDIIKEIKDVVNEEIPIVDLYTKEWEVIEKYGNKILRNNTIDLNEIIENQRYGNILKFPYQSINGVIDYLIVKPFMMENNRIIIMMKYDIDENHQGFISYDLLSTNSFRLDDIKIIRNDVQQTNYNKLSKSVQDIKDSIPSNFLDEETLIELIKKLLYLYIIIHDRPERMRIVRETITRNNKNSHTSHHSDIIIKRILKTAAGAKQHVQERSGSEIFKDYQYTIESWGRVGHYRSRNGKSFWVRETICKRHKEIKSNNNPIHIKL
jgi:hypothetical protein